MNVAHLNQLTEQQATERLLQCCSSSAWVSALVQARPFLDKNDLVAKADLAWQNLTEADYLAAFAGHPQIGDLATLRAKYANTQALASDEQSAVRAASEQVIASLAQANAQYLEKFGFIFIVCATGKTAEQMLALLQQRLVNDKATELRNAAAEQRKIFHLRLEKLS
ncbi:2-oxo-4-hydroxy-4-carboxy-5-ureidoimidazoline decarboxylase [Colwellia chukchiensis]|uniref:2-oxo-4-hydroxy-4-carboxy-5-ureidoimidazoline decarboxylase n=1 Tax=Colwellia chukchiensis TaxID=641665 RepID=A0A1H7NXC2_9GAMM|nr:2-oxo-4-hydroxy-4-carboxy-5-ureidoimidazoline decarboxylase [Colwellia chukchiensis]SEL27959.1 2-oxo-4-hydroxy-4-carboxy-5-ureidoimidazoline decarboxylase [Colwellia chukchiensis]